MKSLYPAEWSANASVGEKIASELRMQIISGCIENGTILSENQIAQAFGASRSPVRDALKVLSSEGLIRPERMGAIVSGFTDHDIEEMYDVRVMMELFVLERVIKTDTADLINKLQKIVEMMSVSVQYKDDQELTLKDLKFHETIIQSIHHKRISMMWAELKPLMKCFILLSARKRFSTAPEDFDRIIKNHQFMIEAIASKELENIVRALERNFKTRKMLNKARNQKEEHSS